MLVGHLYCFGSAPQLSDCYGFTYPYFYGCNPSSSHVAGVRCIGKYTVVCKNKQEYVRVCKNMQEYARVCKSMQEYARVCKSMQALNTPSGSEVHWYVSIKQYATIFIVLIAIATGFLLLISDPLEGLHKTFYYIPRIRANSISHRAT